jgi:hypothetical protein
MAEGTARSEGMFPRRAAWCDVETMIPDDGSCNKFPNMTSVRYSNGPRNREINFVAYFSEDAVGSVDVIDCTTNTVVATLEVAAAVKGKAIVVRSGYELDYLESTLDEFKRTTASLTAGTARVFIF